MRKLSYIRLLQVGAALALVVSLVLLVSLVGRSTSTGAFFGAAPATVTLQCLGPPTNFIRTMQLTDPTRSWRAFSVSNGTSKTFFYTPTAVDFRAPTGWVSNYWAEAKLMTYRENSGELRPGRSDIFYASIPTSSIPWRLRLGCYEANWVDPLAWSVSKWKRQLLGLPPTNVKGWNGRRYEVICGEVAP
jgi:hypothetical protein